MNVISVIHGAAGAPPTVNTYLQLLASCSLSCEEKRQMADLHQKKLKLEALVNGFQDDNEEYLQVIKSVGEEVLGVLSNAKVFLRYATTYE
jgi:cell division protein FtsB